MFSNNLSVGYIGSAMNKVYNYMFIGVIVTALVAFGISGNFQLQAALLETPFKWVVILVPLACVLLMLFKFDRFSTTTLAIMYGIVAVAFGASLSTIFLMYRIQTIGLALLSSSSIFAVMSIYGHTTKKDLSSWRDFLLVGIIGLIICQIINIFVQSSVFTMTLSALAVIIFTLMTAYDTQKIRQMMAYANTHDTNKLAIMGALSLYLDFLNLFVNLLQLFGGNRR